MPEISKELTLGVERRKVWMLLNDPVELGKCIPGCEEVVITGPMESRWVVKVSTGIISRRLVSRARITEKNEPNRLAITLQSVDGELTGEITIETSEEGGSGTRMKIAAKISAGGAFQWVVNQVIKGQLDDFVGDFARCVSSRMADG